MNAIHLSDLLHFWPVSDLHPNWLVFLHVVGALLLGLLVGYERSYHGRAAGMRTYGLVCMTSSAMIAVLIYPSFGVSVDPTRVIQGIVTGVGFLGAGIIMRVGLNISGLTTAASIWATSGVGVLMGLGFYFAAILVTGLSVGCMIWISRLESLLPSRHAISITLKFACDFKPELQRFRQLTRESGFEIASGSFSVHFESGQPQWHCIAMALNKHSAAPLTELGEKLGAFEGVVTYHLEHARN